MAAIITTTNVFDFMGTATDQRTTQSTNVTALINEMQKELERTLRRSVTSQTLSSQVLNHNLNCEIIGDTIRLIGDYFDLYSLTALSEEGTALSESTAYNDGNDYVVDYDRGIIKKTAGTWSTADNAIVISGKYGYVNSDDSARDDIKSILKILVAMKSGIWMKTYIGPDGTTTMERESSDLEKDVRRKIKSHINYHL